MFGPADHVAELLEAGEIEKASAVWNDKADYFSDPSDQDRKAASDALAAKLRTTLEPAIDKAEADLAGLRWPSERAEWPAVKSAIDEAARTLADAERHKVLQRPGQDVGKVASLRASLAARLEQIRSGAEAAFASFPLEQGANFFEEYPTKLDGRDFLARTRAAWLGRLSAGPPAQLLAFKETYKDALAPDDLAEIATAFYRAALNAQGKGSGLARVLEAVRQTQDAGLPLAKLADARIRIVEVTSRSLLNDGQIEFPVALDVDLPFQAEKAELDEALSSAASGTAEVVILVDVATARNDRKINSYDGVASEYQAGTRSEPNPDHSVAQAMVTEAQLHLMNIRQQANINSATCYGLGCAVAGIANAVAIGNAEEKMKAAMSRLAATPMTVTKPIYRPYEFNKAAIDAAKVATVNYYVIDKVEKSFVKGTFDVREAKSFVVAYGLHEQDRNRAKHLSSVDPEQAVETFETAPVTVPLSQILAWLGSAEARRSLPSVADLRSELVRGKNKTIAAVKARSYDAGMAQDKRFDSVVVVMHPGGGLGTGFYVRGDLVVTNYHVIRDTTYVELKLHNGTETFGKVIARDVRLDLALIKVQARGTPVTFYAERSLPLGQTVDVIGHPKGLQFSLTRGVISGIRDIPSSFAPSGRPVHFIQTDAAINPGNSGGPLFLGDKVIGVNTQKLVMNAVEGLGFAIHYGEVLDFLESKGVVGHAGS